MSPAARTRSSSSRRHVGRSPPHMAPPARHRPRPSAPSAPTAPHDAPHALTRRDSSSYNTFRASHGRPLNGLLLFPEQPRQVAVLALVAAAISYYAFTSDALLDAAQSGRNALLAAALVFLVYCFLQTRDGLLTRPHPGVWRVVHGASVVYLLALAALVVQNRQRAMQAMQLVFPEVGTRRTTTLTLTLTRAGTTLQCDMNWEVGEEVGVVVLCMVRGETCCCD